MQFKFSQRVLWLTVFVLCALSFAALADGPTPQTSKEHFAEGNKFYRANNKDKAIFHYITEAEADEKKVKELLP